MFESEENSQIVFILEQLSILGGSGPLKKIIYMKHIHLFNEI